MEAMNKARAMLDALMGPGRDAATDKDAAKEKFKDASVCKSYLAGCCPWDPALLGGKRKFAVCERIHSEAMVAQFKGHEDHAELLKDYERQCFKDLQYVVRECEGRIIAERARIRDDWGRKRPPLPVHVIDRVSQMKRESTSMLSQAEALDDDKMKEKHAMLQRSQDLLKEAEAVEEAETEKLKKTMVQEDVCETCGTCYQGEQGNAAHRQFKVHGAYTDIRARLAELEPKYGKPKNGDAREPGAKPDAEGADKPERSEPADGKAADGRRDEARRPDDDRDRKGGRDKDRRRRDDSRDRRDRGRDRRSRSRSRRRRSRSRRRR